MESTRQSPPLQGLSKFLVEHEECGSGFDVSHPEGLGSGHVSMRCRGCGATHKYATATIEFEREVEFEPVGIDRSPPPAEPLPSTAAAPEGPKPAATEPAEKITDEMELPAPAAASTTAKPGAPAIPAAGKGAPPTSARPRRRALGGSPRERAVTVALVAFALAALVFAVIRLSGDSEGPGAQSEAPTTAQSPPGNSQPSAETKSGAAKGGQPRGSAASPATHSGKANAAGNQQAAKHRRSEGKQGNGTASQSSEPTAQDGEQAIETERFSLIVPAGWEQREAAGGFVLAPPGDAPVSVQVYYESDPSMGIQTMIFQTAAYLRSRDSKARVEQAQRLKTGEDPAFKIKATGPAGTQVALGVLSGPYRYLAIESADPGAPEAGRKAAGRALATFRSR